MENRRHGLPRVEQLRRVPTASVRFLSCEPLLEDLGDIDLTGIDWVITGSESGPGHRPMEEAWVRSLRDRCIAAGVPFFFKQATVNNKKVSLPLLDGRVWDEMPPGVVIRYGAPGMDTPRSPSRIFKCQERSRP